MAKVTKDNPYRILLNDLITTIDKQIPIPEEDQVLLLIQLDTVEKIRAFKDWIINKAEGEAIHTTAIEIMNQSAKIGRGEF